MQSPLCLASLLFQLVTWYMPLPLASHPTGAAS